MSYHIIAESRFHHLSLIYLSQTPSDNTLMESVLCVAVQLFIRYFPPPSPSFLVYDETPSSITTVFVKGTSSPLPITKTGSMRSTDTSITFSCLRFLECY